MFIFFFSSKFLIKMILFLSALSLCFILYNPFFLTFSVVLLALSAALILGQEAGKWLFVVLCLVFLGGMMILFFYMLSLVKFSKNMLHVSSLGLSGALVVIMYWSVTYHVPKLFHMSDLHSSFSSMIFLVLTFILFLALLIIVKLLENFKGSVSMKW